MEPGKGNTLSCDRTYANFSLKICEHVRFQVKGMHKEFLAWFKKRKKRAMMMGVVEQSGPKSAGKNHPPEKDEYQNQADRRVRRLAGKQ